MTEPTIEEKFWKKCGVKGRWINNGETLKFPRRDLNNLAKWAFPVLKEMGYEITLHQDPDEDFWEVGLYARNEPFKHSIQEKKDIATAIHRAASEVFGLEELK